MATFRCPTCLFVLLDPGAKRCPSCNKRLRAKRGHAIVLGDSPKVGVHPSLKLDLVVIEREEAAREAARQAARNPAPPAEPEALQPAFAATAKVATPAAPAPAERAPVVEIPTPEPPVVEAPPIVEAPPVVDAPPVVEAPPVAVAPAAPEAIDRTAIFEPSQLDPEMRELLDGLYRKARAEIDEESK